MFQPKSRLKQNFEGIGPFGVVARQLNAISRRINNMHFLGGGDVIITDEFIRLVPQIPMDRTLEAFWTEVIPVADDNDKIRVFQGYLMAEGHPGPVLVVKQDIEVASTGHIWLQALKSNPTGANVTLQAGTALPDPAASAYHVRRICSFTVTDQSAKITGRSLGDKEISVAAGRA